MPGLQPNDGGFRHSKLAEFIETWPVERLRTVTLEEYTDVGSKDTFCYWIEFETEPLGRIGGRPSNKFGIWKRKTETPIVSGDFSFDGEYAWYTKYGSSVQQAFDMVRSMVVAIAENSLAGDFGAVDGIKLDNLTKWKIAFLYSNYRLLPVYKKSGIRAIARHFEHPNYEKARFSELHTFILQQKPKEEDIFDFAYRYYILTKQQTKHNYYIIGSKYEDDDGNDTFDIMPQMLERSVIATGFFGAEDFTHLKGASRQKIGSYCDKTFDNGQEKFATAKRTLSLFLGLRPGDIVAVKSHGKYNKLTIIAYAEVKEVDGKVYEHDPNGLGHIIHVDFLETGLRKDVGLNYALTIHEIIPGAKEGHFERIFGSYAGLEKLQEEADDLSEEDEELVGRINNKSLEPHTRTVAYSVTVSKAHDQLQMAFALHLKKEFPNDAVSTEVQYVDIRRENEAEIHFYEVKPFHSAYQCIRAGIGQLLDYCYSDSNQTKQKYLIIVGPTKATESDLRFIDFVRSSLGLPFEYISYPSDTN